MSAHKTAIKRTAPSAPARLLVGLSQVTGRVLDYGCGQGFDADYYGWNKYDPFWFPTRPKGSFDTILCTYVLNVLPKDDEPKVLCAVMELLRKGGTAFFTVRRDVKKGGTTKKGTYQRNVVLAGEPYVEHFGSFAIYSRER